MPRRPHGRLLVAFTSLVTVISFAPTARAEGDCLDKTNPVIGAGGSASKPLLARIAPILQTLPDPITLIYQSPGACFGITAYVDGTALTGTATYWDADGTEQTCNFPITGVDPDFGMLGVQGTLCEGVDAIPAGIGDFPGPITGWNLIVPNASSQTSISAEAVYFVYGFGAALGQVSPWTVDSELYSRNATSAALIAVALGAGIPPTKFKGVDVGSNGAMISSLAMSLNPEAAIGYVSAEVADLNRDSVRTLAFQAYDQECAYWPDSTVTAFDKRNLRDGHYYLWSPYHFYVPVDGQGEIIDPDTRQFIGWFTGDEPLPAELDLNAEIIANGNIPQCAMQVWRDDEIGPLASYAPPEPCGCYFDFQATGESSCDACVGSEDCSEADAVCRNGFCEAY
ncbi:hypothetical protein ACNOYE_35575 [Nannocystaceae bacterium ST9]